MNILRLPTLSLTLAIAVMTLGYVNPASAAPPPGGFLLTQTDAAYVDWGPDAQDGCTGVSIFVGFVEGTLQLPRGSRPNPDHADVQVILNFDCGSSVTLEGVAQAADCATHDMDKLMSASVTCVFNLDIGGTGIATITGLAWTAVGPIFTTTNHSPGNHSTHRTTPAPVSGTIEIVVADPVSKTFGFSGTGNDDRMTHFNEIQIQIGRP